MYKLETKNVFWYYMKYDIDSMNQSMYKFQEKKFIKYFQPILCETIAKSISKLPWNVYNCGETFAIKLIQGRPCMTQRDTGITMKDYREAEVLEHLNSTSIQYIAYLIFTCLLGLSNAWKLESIKSIE